MTGYLIRRLIYGVFVLIGVNVLTFALFFFVNTPDDMARAQLGAKRVTPEAVEKWKQERGCRLGDALSVVRCGARGVEEVDEARAVDRLVALDLLVDGAVLVEPEGVNVY